MRIENTLKKLWLTSAICGLALVSQKPLIHADVQAGLADSSTQANRVIQIPRGAKIGLTMSGVTRIVPADDDIARGSFVNGKAYLEGITTGMTTVDVYQGEVQHQLISVQVTAPGQPMTATVTTAALPAPAPATPSSNPAPVVIAAVPSISNGISPQVAPRSGLFVSLRVVPVAENPSQALFTITYGNHGPAPADGVQLHYTLDDVVSYITGSASGAPSYDAAGRQLNWNIGSIPAGTTDQTVSFRVEPIDRNPVTFFSVATITDANNVAIASNTLRYSTNPTPLLTVFALPDRVVAGRSASVLVDVQGVGYQAAVDRLQKMGVLNGRSPGLYFPGEPTQRAEYAVMTLKGLNLRDLTDATIIKYVLGRKSVVSLDIVNSQDKVVAQLVKGVLCDIGENSAIWDGRSGAGYATPGRYTYVCTAKDIVKGETTVLKGHINVVPQTPLEPTGTPSFGDVKANDWYAGYLAVAEKQDIVRGYGNGTFRPNQPISRVEATAVLVRSLGLEDLARHEQAVDSGFLDYNDIPSWAVGYVNVAVKLRSRGKSSVGYPGNLFLPNKSLRRDEAALMVERLVDKQNSHNVHLSGQIAPGAAVTIDGKTIPASDDGNFDFVLNNPDNSQPVTVAVLDLRH